MARTRTQSSQRHIPQHRASCPVYKLGRVVWEHWWLLRKGLGTGQQVGRSCSVHHCHPGASFSPSFCSALLHYSYFSNIFVVVIKLFLSQPTGFTFFFFFSWFYSLFHWERWGRWANCCMVLSCWLGFNHCSLQEIWFWVLPVSLRTPFSSYFLWTPQLALCFVFSLWKAMMLFILTIKLEDVQIITFATLVSPLAKQSGGSLISWISGGATFVSKNWDTTGTSVFAICKTFLSRIPGLVAGLPDIPTACSPGCKGRRQQVCNYNTAACHSELFSTSCCQWSTACPGLFEHPASPLSCLATHACIPFYAACFVLLTARCWPWQSNQMLWKRAFLITGQPLHAWRGFQF